METSDIQTRSDVLGWFLTHPDEIKSAVELAAISNGCPPQKIVQWCNKLAGERKLNFVRNGQTLRFKLDSKLAQEARKHETQAKIQTTLAAIKEAEKEPAKENDVIAEAFIAPKPAIPTRRPNGQVGGIGETRKNILELFEMEPDKFLTVAELAEVCTITTQSVNSHLMKLTIEGKIRKIQDRKGTAARYQISEAHRATLGLPTAIPAVEPPAIIEAPEPKEPEPVEPQVALEPETKTKSRFGATKGVGVTRQRIYEILESNPNRSFTMNHFGAILNMTNTAVRWHLNHLAAEQKIRLYKKNNEVHAKFMPNMDHPAKRASRFNPVAIVPKPEPVQTLEVPAKVLAPATVLFLKSIRARLASGETLNEIERGFLLDHLNEL